MTTASLSVAKKQTSASPRLVIRQFAPFRTLAILTVLIVLNFNCQPLLAAAPVPTVRDLSSPDGRQRIEAADYLAANWDKEMGPVLQEIAGFRSEIDFIADSKDQQRRAYFRALTDVVRSMIKIGSRGAIERFREEDSHTVIYTLVRAARGMDRGIRINSTIILANVSDNSSICVAVDELRDPDLDDNGRINLLQVVLTVASYMYQETWQATKKTMEIVREHLDKKDLRDYRRTLDFIEDIEARLESNKRKDDPLPPKHSACKEYRYDRF